MKKNKPFFFVCVLCCSILFIHFAGVDAFASEGAESWRSTYDMVMKWINFFILAFIIVKFGKQPLLNFLNGKKDEIAEEIKILEERKNEVEAKSKETLALIEEGEEHIAKIKARIVEDGERKKQEIIENAQKQSSLMIDKAKKKIENQIMTEKAKFKSELIDSAIDLAMENLPKVITKEDNQGFLDNYFSYKLSK